MNILLICIVIFIVFMAAGYAGLFLQSRLREAHKTGESKSVVGQVSGLVSLLLALVLGTLIGVSFAYYSTQKANLETFSAQILRLDQALGQYGPETKPMRDKIKGKRPLDRTFKVDRRSANVEPVESSGLDTCRTLSFCPNPSRSRCVGWRCLPAPVDAGRGPRRKRRRSSPKATTAGRRFPPSRGATG